MSLFGSLRVQIGAAWGASAKDVREDPDVREEGLCRIVSAFA